LRFLFIGGLNTAVGYLLYAAFLAAGLVPEFALAAATIVGVIFNYFSTGAIVFGHRSFRRLPQFVAIYLVVYALNASALRALINVGVSPFLGQAFLVPVAAAASFLGFRHLVFVRTER
jgi:putative flippase GtrA